MLHIPVTVGGRDLAEFGAKMQSWPEITACDMDTGIFQGAGRNTMHLLQQRRGARRFVCRIDFYGQTPREWTANISAFSALVGAGELEIDIGDGYLYQAILLAEGAPAVTGEIVATVEYQFQAVRHWPAEQLQISVAAASSTTLICHSNYPLTDCRVELPLTSALSNLNGILLIINDKSWAYPQKPTGNIVLDGIRKVYTMGSTIISTTLRWTDFPALRPGKNEISLYEELSSGEGGRVDTPVHIRYTPTFL
jgi:hypothetical protein